MAEPTLLARTPLWMVVDSSSRLVEASWSFWKTLLKTVAGSGVQGEGLFGGLGGTGGVVIRSLMDWAVTGAVSTRPPANR